MRRIVIAAIAIVLGLPSISASSVVGVHDRPDTRGPIDISRAFLRVAWDGEGSKLARFVVESYEPWGAEPRPRFDVRIETRRGARPDYRVVAFYDGASAGWYCDVYELRRHQAFGCSVTRARPGGYDTGANDRIGIKVDRTLLEGTRLRWWVLATSRHRIAGPTWTDRAPDVGWIA